MMKKKLVAGRADGAARQEGVVPLSGGDISTRLVAEVEASRRETARIVSIDMMIVGRIPGVVSLNPVISATPKACFAYIGYSTLSSHYLIRFPCLHTIRIIEFRNLSGVTASSTLSI
jgi:hypothetical protein